MPNWCTTNYVIEGEKKELDTLHQTMKRLQEMPEPLVKNDFGSTWLGCLVKELGEDPEIVNCRGDWSDLERDDETIRVIFETAWSPSYDVIQLLKREYPSLRFYYRAMEPGNQLFQKNDEEGKYFPENIWVDYNGNDIFAIDEQEALQKLKAEYGLPERFTSLDEAEDYYDEAEDEDDYLIFAGFDITSDEDDEMSAALIDAIQSGAITIGGKDDDEDKEDEDNDDDDDDEDEDNDDDEDADEDKANALRPARHGEPWALFGIDDNDDVVDIDEIFEGEAIKLMTSHGMHELLLQQQDDCLGGWTVFDDMDSDDIEDYGLPQSTSEMYNQEEFRLVRLGIIDGKLKFRKQTLILRDEEYFPEKEDPQWYDIEHFDELKYTYLLGYLENYEEIWEYTKNHPELLVLK